MMKQWWMPIASASAPCITGISAPPTIAMHRMPEPWPVCLPSPSIASVKIVGNMIELNRPTAMIAHIATWPVVGIVISDQRRRAERVHAPAACPA